MLALVLLTIAPATSASRSKSPLSAIANSPLRNDSTLGCFEVPGRPDTISRWLSDLPEVEALIVSVDMLAYGGLVASRHASLAEDEALSRLQVLR
jgi:hypothetical protein